MIGIYRWRGEHSLIARMFLRDFAFLQRVYRSSDDQSLRFYSVLSVTATLGSVLLLGLAALLLLFTDAVPPSVHPATARREVVILEFVAVYTLAWLAVEYSVSSLQQGSVAARSFKTRGDLAKWWITTLITMGSIGGAMIILAMAGDRSRTQDVSGVELSESRDR